VSAAAATGEASATLAARSLTKRYGARTALEDVNFELQAIRNAFSAAGPRIGWPLVYLAVLTLAFGALGRLALRPFA
jgi:hypothetical protein